jgi:hypothetical protein
MPSGKRIHSRAPPLNPWTPLAAPGASPAPFWSLGAAHQTKAMPHGDGVTVRCTKFRVPGSEFRVLPGLPIFRRTALCPLITDNSAFSLPPSVHGMRVRVPSSRLAFSPRP